MRSGQMRDRILIQYPLDIKGTMGGTSKEWRRFYQCWGDVKELSGRELTQSDQLQSRIIASCFMRYTSGINASMRVVHGENIYQIDAVINKDGKKKMLELMLYEFR